MHTCAYVWSTRVSSSNSDYSEPEERMHIPHEKKPPYLTGQSHLIDTRRVPNTSRPPIRHSPSPFSHCFSLFLFLSLSQTVSPLRYSHLFFSLPHSRESRIRIYSRRAGRIDRRRFRVVVGPIMEMEILHTRVTPRGYVPIINGWRILPRARTRSLRPIAARFHSFEIVR